MLGGGGIQSAALDDYKIVLADGGDKTGYVLPAQVVDQLRNTFGRSAYQTGYREHLEDSRDLWPAGSW
jgi:hypothetical protein